jgi:glycolate oxidase FAD binding subunit
VHEIADVLREASAAGETVSVGREGGDVVLDLRALDQVLEHEAGDLTCTVEAGIRVGDLNEQLAAHGQMLALDPPGNPTIGACIAADLSGPRRHRYGTMRDLVLGVTIVLADGTVAHSGGKVVKNVAGYDLGKLFCGSEGRLGVVARASLRLQPRPAVERTLVVHVDDADEAYRLTQLVHRSTLVPSAVDLLWPGRLALLLEGGARGVESQLEAARTLLGGDETGGEVWDEIRAAQARAGGRVIFPPRELAEALTALGDGVVRAGVGVAYTADASPLPWPALAERVRAELDPRRVLA